MSGSKKFSNRVEDAALASSRKATRRSLPPEKELAPRLLPLLDRVSAITHLWRTKTTVLYEDVQALCLAEDALYGPKAGARHG